MATTTRSLKSRTKRTLKVSDLLKVLASLEKTVAASEAELAAIRKWIGGIRRVLEMMNADTEIGEVEAPNDRIRWVNDCPPPE